jgi:hypothetical protein
MNHTILNEHLHYFGYGVFKVHDQTHKFSHVDGVNFQPESFKVKQ